MMLHCPVALFRPCRHGALLSLLFVLGASPAWAQAEPAAPTLPLETAEATDEQDFTLPKDLKTPEECFKFIEEVAATEPTDDSEAAMIVHQRKLARTVVEAAEKALTLDPTKEETMQATFVKLQALGMLSELNEPGADEQFQQAIAAARDSSEPDVQAVGMKFYVESGFGQWPMWDEHQKTALLADVTNYLAAGQPSVAQLRTLLTVMQFLEAMDDEALAKPLLAKLIPHFESSDDQQIQEVVKKLKGTVRRLNLPGNQMELSGTLLDGSEFDWSAYRGKVVLVDFWATWCQPCRQEVPNVLKLYEAYHDKGFDVVGISLDEKREQAESYIEQYDVPWPNIFSEDEDRRGWEQPLAVYYGITGIPRAILVDRDGTVVNLQARGQTLGRELRRLLGEPVASTDQSDDALVKQVDALVPAE